MSSSFLGPPPTPGYHLKWFFPQVLKLHSPTILPQTSHPSVSTITAFPPDKIWIHWISSFSLGLSAPSDFIPSLFYLNVINKLSPHLCSEYHPQLLCTLAPCLNCYKRTTLISHGNLKFKRAKGNSFQICYFSPSVSLLVRGHKMYPVT